ncbi:MAG: response regulator [Myxococcales bacterium]|nr:response regulator [Myxococcales bacterium]
MPDAASGPSVLSAQHRVRTASDGAAALAELAREPADVILLDRSMPGAPGPQLLRALRESAPTAKRVRRQRRHSGRAVTGSLHARSAATQAGTSRRKQG